ncbi:helix-turn-helix domain-containing protein [Campylobacter jejuni]|nr:helix-turn-helix domain-containing protein [Campylobacter jejuni]
MKAKEVLKLLKISRVTLYKYVKSGKIRVTQMPNSLYLI